jgi:hypothetical protein
MEICNTYASVELCKTYGDKAANINEQKAPPKYKHRTSIGTERYVYFLYYQEDTEENVLIISPINHWRAFRNVYDGNYTNDARLSVLLANMDFRETQMSTYASQIQLPLEHIRTRIEESGIFLFDKSFYDDMALVMDRNNEFFDERHIDNHFEYLEDE